MSKFEDDLWEELSREHGAATARARRPSGFALRRGRVMPLVAGALTFVAVTAMVVVLTFSGSNIPPAYAITQNANGTVTLALNELIGVRPANEELARLGVRVVVAKAEVGCHETGRIVRSSGGSVFGMVETAKGFRWVIHPAEIPLGDTVRLSVQIDPHSRIPAVGERLGLFRGEAPRCSKPIFA